MSALGISLSTIGTSQAATGAPSRVYQPITPSSTSSVAVAAIASPSSSSSSSSSFIAQWLTNVNPQLGLVRYAPTFVQHGIDSAGALARVDRTTCVHTLHVTSGPDVEAILQGIVALELFADSYDGSLSPATLSTGRTAAAPASAATPATLVTAGGLGSPMASALCFCFFFFSFFFSFSFFYSLTRF